ncbi:MULTISPECIES: phenylalanine--tRNA ligase beta subunit-related protein [unclassified Pseudomonas]|uniref:phenylalanine--tRNA ligase beta subunit-related protein n=1 Tax=unclassified Pseudomonas TaxID=196821 RepID=UPI0024488794|nr:MULTISPECIES: phenylalanine--tRNA ligase beta subunit-related protein [unclassified Pseudomonas]MDH0302519.1 B3/4 domain-containing protein [Pseudomonas sp. GD04091]MDH1983762.1 B3/4 domain-containing protein [Pseudomonas sp. GD03689]
MSDARLRVRPCATAVGVCNPCAAVISNVRVAQEPTYLPVLQENLNAIAERMGTLHDDPVFTGFASQLASLGYPGTMSANERLLKNFVARGVKSINTLVDAYNAVAIRHGISIGAHRFDEDRDIEVFRAPEPMRIHPMFARKACEVPAGDLLYAVEGQPLAVLGSLDADSHEHRITAEVERVVVVILGHEYTSAAFNRARIAEVIELLGQSMPQMQAHFLETVFET